MSQLQQLARDRNYFKYVLTGISKPFNIKCLEQEELITWNAINNLKSQLLKHFDKNSIILGLKVPEHRCYYSKCRCKVKYIANIDNDEIILKFCKKHFNEYLDYYGDKLGTVSEVDRKTV